MDARGISHDSISASRYAKSLFQHITSHEPYTLVDNLIIGAYIEAKLIQISDHDFKFHRGIPIIENR